MNSIQQNIDQCLLQFTLITHNDNRSTLLYDINSHQLYLGSPRFLFNQPLKSFQQINHIDADKFLIRYLPGKTQYALHYIRCSYHFLIQRFKIVKYGFQHTFKVLIRTIPG